MDKIIVPATELADNPSEEEMRHQLIDSGVAINNNITYSNLVDIHDATINKKQQIYQEGMAEQKIFPLENSIFINQHNVLIFFDIKTGGSFIQHSSLEIIQQIQLLCHF
jgi:hypothetical protein